MNCYFCSNDITYCRLRGLTKPAGTFYCVYCTRAHNFHKVIVSINVNQEPLEAIIHLNEDYLFKIDYYNNKTDLINRKNWSKEEVIVTTNSTNITPTNALNKFKTYILFS